MSFMLCKSLSFFSFLVQPRILHVPEPVLECLPNVTIGHFFILSSWHLHAPCAIGDYLQETSKFLHRSNQISLNECDIDVLVC